MVSIGGSLVASSAVQFGFCVSSLATVDSILFCIAGSSMSDPIVTLSLTKGAACTVVSAGVDTVVTPIVSGSCASSPIVFDTQPSANVGNANQLGLHQMTAKDSCQNLS